MGSSAGLTVVDRLAADLRAWREQGRIPGAALAITDLEGEDLVLVDGLSDVERRIPVSATHRFQIGSISKAATAMALLRAVAAGRVALDDSVRRRLPWFVAGEPPTDRRRRR
jgi:putative ATP-binding cassette transporter